MSLELSLYFTRPELILSFSGLVLLMIAAWRPQAGRLVTILSIVALLGAGSYLVEFLTNEAYEFGADAFSGLYRMDAFGSFTKLLVYFAAAVSLLMAPRYFEKSGSMRAEYPILILFATVGMGIMVSAVDLLTLYIGLELNSLAAYILASFGRNDDRSSEAGLKYFVLGALASGILLYGISLLYGYAGSTSFSAVATLFAGEAGLGPIFGMIFVLSGLAFKISAAPFHMWTPDVYEGAPTPVTAFFASAPKVAATALLIRVTISTFGAQVDAWQQIIIVIALMSIIIGAVGAIGQQSLKRLLAYSSINNVGFMLVGLAAATPDGVAAMLVYLAIYVVMTLGAFAALMLVQDGQGKYLEAVQDVAGLSRSHPGLAGAFAIFMFSLAGVPPLFGFWGKLVVFNAAVAANLLPLAVIAISASVIGAFYYLKVVKVIYFDEPTVEIAKADGRSLPAIVTLTAIAVSPLGYFAIPYLAAITEKVAGAVFL